MNSQMVSDNSEVNNSPYVKQEAANYAYDPSAYVNYSTATTPTTLNQPLPGQPPLPPMPPPQGAVPPPPSVYGTVQAQMAPQLHAWTHTWPHTWITPHTTQLPSQSQVAAAAVYQNSIAFRNGYIKRERFNNHNRNQNYSQRGGNYHNRRNKRQQRLDQSQNQFENQASYLGALQNNFPYNDTLVNQMHLQNQLPHMTNAANSKRSDESGDQDIKLTHEEPVKKNKQRKPMSQSYPKPRGWTIEDAERALKIENEHNKSIRAQSLIIKFPDPDLNKDIVKKFHSGIQNIHFQSPSGPRYCFVQMSDKVDIDEAIKELEKIPFGVGHLKVERKSMRDEDNPTPNEIDPHTLYVGNLPEGVNINEVKKKFPTAVRVDVGFAQKMRNTRYAFIRYTNVDDSIAAYKEAHNLMWDTRSIIVRFRRQRGNTCLPGEKTTNANLKNNKGEAAKSTLTSNSQEKEKQVNEDKETSPVFSTNDAVQSSVQAVESKPHDTSKSSTVVVTDDDQEKPTEVSVHDIVESEENTPNKISLITEIKEEPIDYDEGNDMSMEDDDDDDDEGELYHREDDEDSDYDDDLSDLKQSVTENSNKVAQKDDIPSDDLDKMFNNLCDKSIISSFEM